MRLNARVYKASYVGVASGPLLGDFGDAPMRVSSFLPSSFGWLVDRDDVWFS